MADEHGLDQDRLVWMFTQMLRIREFEERVKRSFTELPGLLRGHTHLADGAEASIVGSLAALRPGDQILTTYRCHGYPIVLGTDPKAMMAEIFGKRTGLCGGYGGSMHLTDVARGFLGTSGIVGQGIPQATAAERLAGEGVSAEVIDPRTLAPLDTATVIESVSKTGHLVLVDQATRHASASAVIAAEVADAGFGYLKAPIKQVTGLDTPIPYSKPMEEHVLPDEDKIVEAVRQVLSTTLVT